MTVKFEHDKLWAHGLRGWVVASCQKGWSIYQAYLSVILVDAWWER